MKSINKITHLITGFIMIGLVLIIGMIIVSAGLTYFSISGFIVLVGLAISAVRYYIWSVINLIRSDFIYPPNKLIRTGLIIALIGVLLTGVFF